MSNTELILEVTTILKKYDINWFENFENKYSKYIEDSDFSEDSECDENKSVEYNDLSDKDKLLVKKVIQDRLDDFCHAMKDYKYPNEPFRYLFHHTGKGIIESNKIILKINFDENKFDKSHVLDCFDSEVTSGYFNNDGDPIAELSIGCVVVRYYNSTYNDDCNSDIFNVFSYCEKCGKLLKKGHTCDNCV